MDGGERLLLEPLLDASADVREVLDALAAPAAHVLDHDRVVLGEDGDDERAPDGAHGRRRYARPLTQRSRSLADQDPPLQLDGRLRRLEAQLLDQPLAALEELAQRVRAPAGARVGG